MCLLGHTFNVSLSPHPYGCTDPFLAWQNGSVHPYNVFDFTVNRKRDGPQQFLANYQGYLHADASSGYDVCVRPTA